MLINDYINYSKLQSVTVFNRKIYVNLKYFETSYIDCFKIATIVLVLLHELYHYYLISVL